MGTYPETKNECGKANFKAYSARVDCSGDAPAGDHNCTFPAHTISISSSKLTVRVVNKSEQEATSGESEWIF